MRKIDAISTVNGSKADELFITCESFEDRCIGAVSRLRDYSTRLLLIISFLSRTRNPKGESKRKKNMSDMLAILSDKKIGVEPKRLKVNPYNPLDLLLSIKDELSDNQINLSGASVTVDISCFTKIQLLFLLRFLQSSLDQGSIRLIYTLPSYYGSLDRKRLAIGYDRLVIAPFERDKPEGLANRRVTLTILLGHEGTRAMHAWSELEPDNTILVEAFSEGDLEMTRITERQNETLLTKVREGMPDFSLYTTRDIDMPEGIRVFQSIIQACVDKDAQKLAFAPIGPKPLVAAFALSAYKNGHIPVDIVYPVPQAYDPDYSIGIGPSYTYIWPRELRARY